MKYLVIIPTYNEKENIQRIIPEVLKQSPGIDILVVDDTSPDKTYEIVRGMAKKISGYTCICARKKKDWAKRI